MASIRARHHGPDVTIAAGPDTLVLATNSSAWILDKAGAVYDFKAMETFFSPLEHPAVGRGTDPVVMFDPQVQRFFLVKADWIGEKSFISLAVSKSSSPTSLTAEHWHFFIFDRFTQRTASGTREVISFGDADTLSANDDVLAICWWFGHESDFSGSNSVARFIDKAPLINGVVPEDWIDVVDFTNGRVAFNIGESDTFFLVNDIPYVPSIWAVRNLLPSPDVSSTRPPQIAHYLEPSDIPQPDGPPIDAVKARTQPIYSEGSLWVAGIVWKDFGEGAVSAIHWVQLDVTDWPRTRVIQSGVLGEPNAWYFAPAIMADARGNFALLYVRSSETNHISSHFTGRLASDPPNTLRPSTTIVSSQTSYARIEGNRNRFVDYLGMALDPVDGSVWMMTIYPIGGDDSASWVVNMDWNVAAGP